MNVGDAELQYKGYKAQIPSKWTSFESTTKLPTKQRAVRDFFFGKELSLEQAEWASYDEGNLGGEGAETAAGNTSVHGGGASSGPSAAAAAGGSKKKLSWAEEMRLYVKEQEMIAETKARAQEREDQMRARQERKNKRREAQSNGGSPFLASSRANNESAATTTSSSSQAHGFPADVLAAAQEAQTAMLKRRREQLLEAKIARYQSVAEKHEKLSVEKNKRVASERQELSGALAERTDRLEREAHKRFLALQQKRREELEHEIKKSDARVHEQEVRLEARRQEKQQQLAEQRAEKERQVAQALADEERKRKLFEREITEHAEEVSRRLQAVELERVRVAEEDHVGKALERAKVVREQQRSEQLAACEKAEHHRLQALKSFEANQEEAQQERARINQSRESRADANLSRLMDRSATRTQQLLRKAHSPAPSPIPLRSGTALSSSIMAPADQSAVLEDLHEHCQRSQQRLDETLDSYERKAEAKRLRMLALEKAQEEEQKTRNQQGRQREESNLQKRLRAATQRAAWEEAVSKSVTDRDAKHEKLLEAMENEVRESHQAVAAEKAKKILDALELVQVKQRDELLKAMESKEKRVAESMQRSQLARQQELEAKQAEQASRQERTREMILARQRERDHEAAAKLQEKELHRQRAAMQREESQIARTEQLAKQAAQRDAAIAAEKERRTELFLKKTKKLHEEDHRRAHQLEAYRREVQAALEESNQAREERTNKAHAVKEKFAVERLDRTIGAVANCYERTKDTRPLLRYVPPRPHSTPL